MRSVVPSSGSTFMTCGDGSVVVERTGVSVQVYSPDLAGMRSRADMCQTTGYDTPNGNHHRKLDDPLEPCQVQV